MFRCFSNRMLATSISDREHTEFEIAPRPYHILSQQNIVFEPTLLVTLHWRTFFLGSFRYRRICVGNVFQNLMASSLGSAPEKKNTREHFPYLSLHSAVNGNFWIHFSTRNGEWVSTLECEKTGLRVFERCATFYYSLPIVPAWAAFTATTLR